MKKRIFIIILIISLIFLIAVLFFTKVLPKQYSSFPPSKVECFDSFMNAVSSGYADGFKIPAFNFSDISSFRCASQVGFNQYEISGIDKSGHSFYLHKDEGGMASSGADGYYDFCYKVDGVVVKSDKIVGRGSHQEGTCIWTLDFPSNLTSMYKYRNK